MQANEQTDQRVAQYLLLYSCLFQTTVYCPCRFHHYPPSQYLQLPLRRRHSFSSSWSSLFMIVIVVVGVNCGRRFFHRCSRCHSSSLFHYFDASSWKRHRHYFFVLLVFVAAVVVVVAAAVVVVVISSCFVFFLSSSS